MNDIVMIYHDAARELADVYVGPGGGAIGSNWLPMPLPMASSTSNPYEAAARAASKFFGVFPTRILLQRAPDCSHFLAGYNSADLSAAEAASLTGFKTASQLLTEEADERDRLYQQQRGGLADALLDLGLAVVHARMDAIPDNAIVPDWLQASITA